MGLDISITRRKKKLCPYCSEVVGFETIAELKGGGRAWYPILERFGYYVPHELRTEENDWYGKDMVLTAEQADELYRFSQHHDLYVQGGLLPMIAQALNEGDEIVINADW
ncbi:MAG: hypothetical protein IJ960_06830 [Oscillospiraceae bacterium]|nr:hypothetical protein [Oscillospiraceae bacterium]